MTERDSIELIQRVLERTHPGHVALACASLGWRVLPLDRQTKRPVMPAWPERATTDRDELVAWFADGGRYTGRVPGVATGRETGAWVLDVDRHHRDGANGFETLAALEREPGHGPLPSTFAVETASGGRHLWFRYPPEAWGEVVTKPGTLGPGLDTRGWGGQVVAPGVWLARRDGSWAEYRVVDDRAPVDAPGWLLARVRRTVGELQRGWSDAEQWSVDGRPLNDGEVPVGRTTDEWLAEAVDLGDGEQEWFLFRFMSSLRARDASVDDMRRLGREAIRRFRVWHEDEPWTTADVEQKIQSVLRYPAGSSARSAARPIVIPEVEEADVTRPELHNAPNGDDGAQHGGLRTVRDVELPEVGGSPENPHRNTDRANGIEVARFLDGRAFWTPEQGWFVYDGRRWAPDVELVRLLLIGEFTDQLRRRVTSGEHAGRDEGEVLMARANRIESSSGLHGALTFAQAYVATSVTRLDVDPWLLNCPNGTLDLRTGDLGTHDPRNMITRITPTPYDAEAADDVWDRVRREALEGDEHRLRLLARFAGYTLTGRTTEKRMLVISGPTNTAKSTITEPLYRALGSVHDGGYATTWDADVVQADSAVNRDEKLNKVRGARMVLVGELSKGSRMADNFVKQFTGGDTMDARALYKGSYSYRPEAKLWMATNYVPHSADPALQERLLLLPFLHTPRDKDPRLKAHLEDSADAQRAMLAWAVRGCTWWQRERSLGATPWLGDAKREYALASDPLLQFIEDRCEVVETYDESSHVDAVWRSYSMNWAVDNVQRPLRRRAFEAALRERGWSKYRGPAASGGEMRWNGLKVTHEV